jgi:hypothetical protein
MAWFPLAQQLLPAACVPGSSGGTLSHVSRKDAVMLAYNCSSNSVTHHGSMVCKRSDVRAAGCLVGCAADRAGCWW